MDGAARGVVYEPCPLAEVSGAVLQQVDDGSILPDYLVDFVAKFIILPTEKFVLTDDNPVLVQK